MTTPTEKLTEKLETEPTTELNPEPKTEEAHTPATACAPKADREGDGAPPKSSAGNDFYLFLGGR